MPAGNRPRDRAPFWLRNQPIGTRLHRDAAFASPTITSRDGTRVTARNTQIGAQRETQVIGHIKRLWAAAPIATLLLALALLAAGVFTVRSVTHAVYWRDPAHRAQPIEPWMTPGFIARSWHLPRGAVIEALHAPVPPPDGPMDLEELAAFRGVPVETVIAEAEALVAPRRADDASPTDPQSPDAPAPADAEAPQ
jgi:hypothetical protein